MLTVFLITLFIFVDQFFKLAARVFIGEGKTVNILGSFLQMTYYKNTGAAFGSFADKTTVLTVISAIIIIILFVLLVTVRKNTLMRWALTLIIAGGIGNLIDRFVFGSVTDMFKLIFFRPIFNFADVCVTVGCVLLIVGILTNVYKLKTKSNKGVKAVNDAKPSEVSAAAADDGKNVTAEQ